MWLNNEINEIAAKQALLFVYDAAVLDLKNVYHCNQTDGLNSSNFYDLYHQISLSGKTKLYHIKDGDFLKIGDDDYQIPIINKCQESPVYILDCLFESFQNALNEFMDSF